MKIINFDTIKIQNFLSIGKEVVIDFKDGINAITGENKDKDDGNGVGKSTIIDALYFVLYGTTLRELKKENIVNNFAKKNCKVTLLMTVDNNGVITKYMIERGISPSFCNVFVNGTPDKTLSTIPATNNYILNIINTTSSVFKNTIAMSMNNTIPFMAQKKNEKRDFIEGILRLEIFKVMNKLSKEIYDNIFKEYDFAIKSHVELDSNIRLYISKSEMFESNRNARLADYTNRLTNVNQEIEDLEREYKSVDKKDIDLLRTKVEEASKRSSEELTKYHTINTAIITNSSNIVVCKRNIAVIEERITNLQKELIQIDEGKDIITQRITDNELEIKRLETNINNIRRDIKDHESTILSLEKKGAECDKCKRPFSDSDIDSNKVVIKDCKKSITDLTVLQHKTTTAINKLQQSVTNDRLQITIIDKQEDIKEQIADYKTEVEGYNIPSYEKIVAENKLLIDDAEKNKVIYSEIHSNLYKELDDLYKQELSNKFILKTIDDKKTSAKNLHIDITKITNEINSFDDLIVTSNGKKVLLETSIEEYKERVKIYDVIKFLVSDEGGKASIIKRMLTVLNERVNYYLVALDTNCTLTFDEYFDDKIINDRNVECSYENFSQGERKRIDLACLFTFMDLRRLQGDVRFSHVTFDELLDGALSTNGLDKLFDILKERHDKYNESCYIITHKKENLKNKHITDILYLEKVGGITKIKDK